MASRTRSFLRRHPKLVALAFGLAVCAAFALIVEVGCGILLRRRPPLGPEDRDLSAPSRTEGDYEMPDEKLCSRPPANGTIRGIKWNHFGPIYDYTYHSDALRHRVVPFPDPERPRDQFLMFFGCSYTFGEGVNDEDTMPAKVAQRIPYYRPHNLAFRGYGPGHMFVQIDRDEFADDFPQRKGVAIYTFISHHKERLFGSMHVTTNWGQTLPMIEPRRGRLQYRGPFSKVHPWRLAWYNLIKRSNFVQYFGLNPPRFTDWHDRRFAEVVAASRDEFLKKFPGSRFIVCFFPRTMNEERLKQHMRDLGLEVLDLTDAIPGEWADIEKVYFFKDYHPRPNALELVAGKIADYLEAQGLAEGVK